MPPILHSEFEELARVGTIFSFFIPRMKNERGNFPSPILHPENES